MLKFEDTNFTIEYKNNSIKFLGGTYTYEKQTISLSFTRYMESCQALWQGLEGV